MKNSRFGKGLVSHLWACAGITLLLFFGNALVIRELFVTEYTKHIGSIEAAFISLSHNMQLHWHERVWWPLWYAGIPFQNSYPPFLHNVVAITADAAHISAALAYHRVTAIFYCLGPVTLYWLVLRLSRSQAASLAAGLLHTVFSTSALLLPSVRNDLITVWGPRRLQALVKYGEGPHVAAMALLPIPILLLDTALVKRKPWWWVGAAVAMVLVVLTNWLGAFALFAAVLSYSFSRPLSAGDRLKIFYTGLYAYALAVPWIPPSTLLAVRTNAQRVGGAYSLGGQHLIYAAVAVSVFCSLVVLSKQFSTLLRFGILFTALMGALPLLGEFAKIYLLPQPERYHLEMEVGIAMLAGCLFACLWAWLWKRRHWRGLATLVAAGLVFCFFSGKKLRRQSRELTESIEISRTVEHRVSRWMEEHLRGQRVLAPGSVSYWMNAFTSTPQLMGGFDQGITNPLLPAVHYQLYSGEGDGGRELAIALLQSYGVGAVLVGGPSSREVFHPFRKLERFEHLRTLWRDGDDVLYEVPRMTESLAHAVRRADLVEVGSDYFAMAKKAPRFAAALTSGVEWTWVDWQSGRAIGQFGKGELLSLQISYHPGWRAFSGGKSLPVRQDGMGLTVVEPGCAGLCTVELRFDGGVEAALARWIAIAALLAGLLWCAAYVSPSKLTLWPSTRN